VHVPLPYHLRVLNHETIQMTNSRVSPGVDTPNPRDTTPLRIERRFRASPERVFHAWTSAEELNLWSDPEPHNAQTQVDLRVGGRYRIVMSRPDGTIYRVSGVYREIDPPRRLVYTWRWETMPGFPETVVTVEFRARDDGGTDLLLLHDDLPDDNATALHTHGWSESLSKLASTVN
jgi:uncharacterized protein YndB with AHSA1/START domain